MIAYKMNKKNVPEDIDKEHLNKSTIPFVHSFTNMKKWVKESQVA